MSKFVSAVAASVALVAICGSVYVYQVWRDEAARSEAIAVQSSDRADQIDKLTQELEALNKALAASRAVVARLESELKARAEEELARTPEPAESEEPTDASAVKKRDPHAPYVLASLADADRLSNECLERGDLESLWLLGADLLALGPEGYEKLISLLDALSKDKEKAEMIGTLWNRPEIMVGPFFRAVVEHEEDLLRFGLYLDSKDKKTLPEPLRELHDEFDDELGPIALGFYQGDDAEILDGYTRRYQNVIQEQLEAGKDDYRDAVHALGQLPTEAAETTLIELVPRAQGRTLEAVVRNLAWRRSERAIPVLRSLAETSQDPKLRGLATAALHYME